MDESGLLFKTVFLPFQHIPAGLRKRKEAADSDTESDISQVSAVVKKVRRIL